MLSLVMPVNFILAADAYKCGHWLEIPKVQKVTYAAIVPRKVSDFSPLIVAMGQAFVAMVLANVRITMDDVDEAEIEVTQQGYQFNREGWETIVREFGGRLPLAMYGVEEGRLVKPQTPVAAIFNTDDRFAWLPAYVETWVQDIIWIMSSHATVCRAVRVIGFEAFKRTGTDLAGLDYFLHNFGDRSAGSPEEGAVMSGISQAAVFNGSDCLRANRYIKRMYNTAKPATSSVEAFEHSTVCANSDAEAKDDYGAAVVAVERLEDVVEKAKQGLGTPLLSVVIDTYDDERFVKEYLSVRLKDRILKSGGRMVGRPDSGDPTERPGQVGRWFADAFGSTKNDSGFEVLNPAVGVIQGDGIDVRTIQSVVDGWIAAGFSMDNFCTGMGTGTTNDCTRDTFSWSMKATARYVDGRWERMLKDPKTDAGKRSLSGLVRCFEKDGELEVVDLLTTGQVYLLESSGPGWQLYSKDGYREFRQTFDDVRRRAREGLTS